MAHAGAFLLNELHSLTRYRGSVPYFFILVFFILFLLAMLAGAAVLFFIRFRWAALYVLGAALGSGPGFVGPMLCSSMD